MIPSDKNYNYLGRYAVVKQLTAGTISSGTWILLHYLSVHATQPDDYETITQFVGSFFSCGGCADHFTEMYGNGFILCGSNI